MSRAWRSLGVIVLACVCVGCTTTAPKKPSQRAGLVGKPPAAADDPFAERTQPGEEARAPTRGVIGDEDARKGAAAPSNRATPAAPEEGSTSSDVASTSALPDGVKRCFSCVRICPEDMSTSDCEAREDELICGWGADEERQRARRLARAQCDAALDMSRRMGRYSEIDGSCPPAACR